MAKLLLSYRALTTSTTTYIRKAATTVTMSTSALSAPMTLIGSSKTKTPRLVYGTAWKKEKTADLVYQAIKAGFRGIDTAAQPKHYQENLVGDGIRRAISDGIVKREDLFVRLCLYIFSLFPAMKVNKFQIQTKYTPISGQDPNSLPYNASWSIEDQIHASIASSLKNLSSTSLLDESYIDSVLLHSPLPTISETILAWSTLSTYVSSGKIHNLGIANVPSSMLPVLLAGKLSPLPSVIQNRFYRRTNFEGSLRSLCRSQGIIFQSFWTLTGNIGEGQLLSSDVVRRLAENAGVSNAVALYALVIGLEGVSVLDGTTNEEHMKEDLEGLEIVGKWAEADGKEKWEAMMAQFRGLIDDI